MKYKGQILSCIPCKGYAFIKPIWAKETDGSSKNIYSYYASDREKGARRCFINILDKSHPELHEVKTNKRGEEIYLPVGEPQTVWFEVVLQDYKGSYKLMAINLVDEKHITPEERAEAESNVTEPDFNDEHSLVVGEPVLNDSYINAILSKPVEPMLPAVITHFELPVVEECAPAVIYLGTTMTIEDPVTEEIIEAVEETTVEVEEFSEYEEDEEADDEYEEDDYYGYEEYADCHAFVKTHKQKSVDHQPKKKSQRRANKRRFDDEDEED